MRERLKHLSSQGAPLILCNSLAIPKVLYILHTTSCFYSKQLGIFDETIKSILSDILNVNLSHERAWLQASGPSSVFRGPCQFAPSAFLASATGCSALVEEIVGSSNASTQHAVMECAIAFWHEGHSEQPPSTLHSSCQHFWDAPCAVSMYNLLLEEAQDSQTN